MLTVNKTAIVYHKIPQQKRVYYYYNEKSLLIYSIKKEVWPHDTETITNMEYLSIKVHGIDLKYFWINFRLYFKKELCISLQLLKH